MNKDFDKITSESYLEDLGPKHILKPCFDSELKGWFLNENEGRYPSIFPQSFVSNKAEVLTLRHRIDIYIPECDTCYGLVGEQVNTLREMRTNLTDMLTELRTNDSTVELGSFTTRLQETISDMNALTQFVSILVLKM